MYQKGDKGKRKVGNIPDLTIKDNLPPLTKDTPSVVAEAQVEIQDQNEERMAEEVNIDNIDPESKNLFTMNVDTQDINIVVDKTYVYENVVKPAKQEQEQITLELTVDMSKADKEKEEVMKEVEPISIEAKQKIITEPSTSAMEFRSTKVTDILLDSIKKITTCNALSFKAICDTLPIFQFIALACKVDDIVGSIDKLDTLSKFVSSNIQ